MPVFVTEQGKARGLTESPLPARDLFASTDSGPRTVRPEIELGAIQSHKLGLRVSIAQKDETIVVRVGLPEDPDGQGRGPFYTVHQKKHPTGPQILRVNGNEIRIAAESGPENLVLSVRKSPDSEPIMIQAWNRSVFGESHVGLRAPTTHFKSVDE
jgi:hypothetical protein